MLLNLQDYYFKLPTGGKYMIDKQGEQLKEMCIIMIDLLNKLRIEGKISDAEYNEQIRVKEQFLDRFEQNSEYKKTLKDLTM